MPDLPAFAAAQNVSTPTPIGDTIPSPVMTGWRFMKRKSPRPRCFLVSYPSAYVNKRPAEWPSYTRRDC